MTEVLISPEPHEFGDVALALLTLAGPERANEVRTTSDAFYGLGFSIPEDLHAEWVDLITGPGEGGGESEPKAKRPYNRKPKTVTDVPVAELEPELALTVQPLTGVEEEEPI